MGGSSYVLACFLDKEKSALEKTEWLRSEDLIRRFQDSFVASGQRIRFLLSRILEHTVLQTSAVWPLAAKLTFDSSKAPVLEPVQGEVHVILPELMEAAY